MRNESILTIAKNTDGAWLVEAYADDQGTTRSVFDPADALEAIAWGGGDSDAAITLVPDWTDAATGRVRLTLGHAASAAASVGVYPLQVVATLAATSQRVRVLEAWLAVTESPGDSTALPTYGALQDLYDYGGGEWLHQLRRSDGLANFASERARARSYLDAMILRKWRPWSDVKVWSGSALSGPMDGTNPSLSDYLAAGALVVDDDVRELVALKALELICRQRITLSEKDEMPRRASYYQSLARNKALRLVAQLDTNDDGVIEYAIPLGVVSIR